MVLLLVMIVSYVCVYLVVYYDKNNLTEVEKPDMIELLTTSENDLQAPDLRQNTDLEQDEERGSSDPSPVSTNT